MPLKGEPTAAAWLNSLSLEEREVARLLWREPMTRQELARRLSLSLSAVSRLLSRLFAARLVTEERQPCQARGRPPALLRLNHDSAYGLGIDIGALYSRYAVADLSGNIVSKHLEKTPLFHTNRDFSDYLCSLAARAQASVYRHRHKLVGIVASISGVVDTEQGLCLFCPNIRGPLDLPVRSVLEQEFALPVAVEDPARMQALAEHLFGGARGHEDFLYVHIGIGVGAGIMLGGRLLRGSVGVAGEIGHIVVGEGNGPRCNCGNRGCLEAYVSARALVRRAREGLEQGIYSSLSAVAGQDYARLTPEAIDAAARAGDKMAFHIVDEAGQRLGSALATAVNLLGTPLVVIGGGLGNLCDSFYAAAERAMRTRALSMLSPRVTIRRSSLDTYAAAHGSAMHALERALDCAH
jgi:predicted NBD/HSP70 family sugar kinase